MQQQHLDSHRLSVGLNSPEGSVTSAPWREPAMSAPWREPAMTERATAERANAAGQPSDGSTGQTSQTSPTAVAEPGWLRGVHMRVLVAGMAALGVLALVYPDARRREISAAAEAIHQCDLAAANATLDVDARAQARTHCHQLRVDYAQRYGQDL